MDYLQIILTALLSAFALFIITKLIGHKQLSQLDFFDYITGITIGSIAAELATELEKPLRPFIAMVVYGGITVGLSLLSNKCPRLRKYLNGAPTILMQNGKIYRQNLKKAKLDLSEFMMMCRQAGYFNPADIHTAVFEYNGHLSILPLANVHPATPDDLGVRVTPAAIHVEVIMDGRTLGDNLHRMGLDEIWLERQLDKQGISSPSDVLLALCDDTHTLKVFEGK